VESDDEPGAASEGSAESRQYGDWLSRTLGPDWVEVEPGIFQPPAARTPEPEPEPEPTPEAEPQDDPEAEPERESLDEALWPKAPEPDPREPVAAPSKRSWWRRG
jgi:hypothetical protein